MFQTCKPVSKAHPFGSLSKVHELRVGLTNKSTALPSSATPTAVLCSFSCSHFLKKPRGASPPSPEEANVSANVNDGHDMVHRVWMHLRSIMFAAWGVGGGNTCLPVFLNLCAVISAASCWRCLHSSLTGALPPQFFSLSRCCHRSLRLPAYSS